MFHKAFNNNKHILRTGTNSPFNNDSHYFFVCTKRKGSSYCFLIKLSFTRNLYCGPARTVCTKMNIIVCSFAENVNTAFIAFLPFCGLACIIRVKMVSVSRVSDQNRRVSTTYHCRDTSFWSETLELCSHPQSSIGNNYCLLRFWCLFVLFCFVFCWVFLFCLFVCLFLLVY